jgi:hypothetical protein
MPTTYHAIGKRPLRALVARLRFRRQRAARRAEGMVTLGIAYPGYGYYIDRTLENPMSVRQRIRKYRSSGGAADLVRVEVLVPPSARDDIIRLAARLRSEHRDGKELKGMCDRALSLYGPSILDNVDLERLPDLRARADVIARAMIERGDARAFALGREILARVEEQA